MRSSRLIRMLPALVAAVVAAGSAHAQTDYRTQSSGMFTIGIGFAGGASLTLEPPEGSKIKPVFAWRLTTDMTYPINPTVAAQLSLGLDNRGVRRHHQANADAWADEHISYFSMYPSFKFSVVSLGVNFMLPMGGSVTYFNGQSEDFTDEINDKLHTLIEPRLGITVPIVDEEIGWLGLTFGGGVTIGDYIETPAGSEINNQMVSGHAGLTWQFGIKGTGRR